jgi:sigma-B regulation protein RsbU (phosphoserine phosphatase)
MTTGLKSWSEPYFDEGGGNYLMTTYTDVLYDKRGAKIGVVTADITLADFSRLISWNTPYKSAVSMMISSRAGLFIAHDDPSKLGLLAVGLDNELLKTKQSGKREINYEGKQRLMFFIQLPTTDWRMVILVDKEEVFSDFHKMAITLAIIFGAGIVTIIVFMLLIIKKITRPVVNTEEELKIAHDIQMSMIPRKFPAFPGREDITLFADLRPARTVGGDLYNFLIKDNKLYFIIGDVSGKGVPAALFMATTKSAFDSLVGYFNDPADILRAMNKVLTEHNSFDMFVTLFVAVLDLQTGNLQYCNAGHNPPVLLNRVNKPSFISTKANIPAGVLKDYPYISEKIQLDNHTSLLLYTDGLTEAENSKKELLGNQRLLNTLAKASTDEAPQQLIKRVEDTVKIYVSGAEQNDDIALLAINYSFPHELILPNKTSEIACLNTFLETIGEELRLSPALTLKLNLALEEVVANIIQYAYGNNADEQIVIRMTYTAGIQLLFTIEDTGIAFDPTMVVAADTSLPLEQRPIGGLGLHLVRQIMDEVTYQRIGNTNQLQLKKNITHNL